MATIMLRHIDTELWNQFRARATAEGVGPRELLVRLIATYLATATAPPTPPRV